MILTRDGLHRTLKLELDEGRAATIEEAQSITSSYRIQIIVGDDVPTSPTRQAALLTAVNTAARAFGGGVYVTGDLDWDITVPWGARQPAHHIVTGLGGTPTTALTEDDPTLVIGTADDFVGSVVMQTTWDGWAGGIVPAGAIRLAETLEHPLAGILAGALGVSEAFSHVRGNVTAGQKPVGLSLWRLNVDWRDPAGTGRALGYLPTRLWLPGLGHLGQAYLWALGFLPSPNPAQIELTLQDFDRIVPANRSTGLLVHRDTPDGVLKTRLAASAMEQLGYRTRIIERPFDSSTRPGPGEPTWALAGFDSPIPRQHLGVFDLAVDLGLGSAVDDYLGIHLHTFPAAGNPSDTFTNAANDSDPELADWAIAAAADRCGVLQLRGAAIGAAFVGAVAATIGLAEVLCALGGQPPTAVASFALNALHDIDVVPGDIAPPGNPGYQAA